MIYDMGKKLRQGRKYEQDFIIKMKDILPLRWGDGRVEDMRLKHHGIELKSDTRSSEDTGNFAIERYSDMERKTDGGPWRSVRDGIKYYFYWFIQDDYFFVSYAKKLVEFIEKNEHKYRQVKIPNKRWTTLCYLVPVSELVYHKIFNRYKLGRKEAVDVFF
jgi:hypothetical protein